MAKQQKDLRMGIIAACLVAGFLLVGIVDYYTGVEIRTYPLYFLPLSLAAWHFRRTGALLAVVVATTIWVVSNMAAGMLYSSWYIWLINTLSQSLAFGTVAALLSWARNLLEREKTLSRTDSLTGLANARAFHIDVDLVAATCRRKGRPLTIAYIDLDNFKCVNDLYGHTRGDELLKDVATIFQDTLRVTDRIARIGGDEFVICLPETSQSQAQPILERLQKALETIMPTDECQVSASIGAFCWDVPLNNVDAMISAADKTMYEVKKSGKNRVSIVSMAEY